MWFPLLISWLMTGFSSIIKYCYNSLFIIAAGKTSARNNVWQLEKN